MMAESVKFGGDWGGGFGGYSRYKAATTITTETRRIV
jgi:hypothetical protein